MINLIASAAATAAPGAGQQYGMIAALEEGGPVTWVTFGVLVIMFVGSLYILFTKLFEQNKVMRQGREAVVNFWRAPTLAEGATKLEKNSAWRQIVEDGLRAQADHSKLSDPVEAHDWMHGTMERAQSHILSKLNGGLSFLATVGATAPFIGLFGTVWGILNALIKIAQTGDPSITVVAGPVGEALIMTAIGLVVAVPAVLAYNWLQSRNKSIGRELSIFSNDVLGNIMSNGQVRPATGPAAAPARPAGAQLGKA